MAARGQAAMEFLMTYGWAVLILLLVVAVLFFAGVFNTGNTVPKSCTLPAGFTCNEFMLDESGRLYLELGQATGRTINITGVGCSTNAGMSLTAMNVVIPSGSHAWVTNTTVTCAGSAAPAFRGKITLQYTTAGSVLTRNVTGDLTFPLATGGASGGAGILWNSSWAYYRPVSITTGASGNLTDFPAYFTFDTASLILAGKMNTSCADLRIVNSTLNGTLSFEIEANTCNTSSTVVYVKLPNAASAGTAIYAFYGNSSAADAQNKTDVWSNNYTAVYHLSDYSDSKGGYTLALSGGTVTSAAGALGVSNTSYSIGTASSYLGIASNVGITESSDSTFFARAKPGAYNVWGTVFQHYGGRIGHFAHFINDPASAGYGEYCGTSPNACIRINKPGVGDSDAYTSWNNPNSWATILLRQKSQTNLSGSVNGSAFPTTSTSGYGSGSNNNFYIGTNDVGRSFTGIVDEVRIASVYRSDDWLSAEYGQTYSVGSEQANS